MTVAAYIIGLPNDTRESVWRNIAVIQKELPIDLLYFTNLTPLAGSEDHRRLLERGVWMDPDLNKFDANHQVTRHAHMSDAEWTGVYREAWTAYYSFGQWDDRRAGGGLPCARVAGRLGRMGRRLLGARVHPNEKRTREERARQDSWSPRPSAIHVGAENSTKLVDERASQA